MEISTCGDNDGGDLWIGATGLFIYLFYSFPLVFDVGLVTMRSHVAGARAIPETGAPPPPFFLSKSWVSSTCLGGLRIPSPCSP
ncbi:hypothetical protein LZ31DRAFT_142120 [Colletotrichum somersetense]|nr:hypothetical protein LZ31DRAFT_142120 [Colletotrichum somersetense]